METPIVSPDDIVGLPNFNVCSYLNRRPYYPWTLNSALNNNSDWNVLLWRLENQKNFCTDGQYLHMASRYEIFQIHHHHHHHHTYTQRHLSYEDDSHDGT